MLVFTTSFVFVFVPIFLDDFSLLSFFFFHFCFVSFAVVLCRRIYRAGGVDPATELLERDLIANDLKQQLLTRPALEELEKRGIKPKPSQQASVFCAPSP